MHSGNESDSTTLSPLSTSFSCHDDSSALRQRPNISSYYSTPGSGRSMSKFSRRRISAVSTIDYLGTAVPSLVVHQICSYLNRKDLISLMMSCKKFNEVGKESKFWEFLNLFGKSISDTSLHQIIDRRIKVLRLNTATVTLSKDPSNELFSSSALSSWSSLPPVIPSPLTHLDLSQAKFASPDIMHGLLERCSDLMALSLESIALDDRTCAEIAKNSNIKYLNLGMTKNISVDGMITMLGSCRQLLELNLAWTDLDDETIYEACRLLPSTLRKLNFSGTRESSAMNDGNVKRICENCPELDEMDLSDDVVISEESLVHIGKLPRLRVLTISRCYGIEPMAFLTLQRLITLNVYGCVTDEGYDVLRGRLRLTGINVTPFSSIARPTVGESVSSIWGQRTRDWY